VWICVSKDHNVTFSSNWITILVFLGEENIHGWDSRTMSFSKSPVFGESEFVESFEFTKPVVFLFV
jgi:hypothetical protein